MISRLSIALALFSFSTISFANDEVEEAKIIDTVEVSVEVEKAPAPAPKVAVIKGPAFDDDEEEDFSIDFSNTDDNAEKTEFVDDIPMDFDITDDANQHKATVKRVAEESIELEEISAEENEEAKSVEWTFDVDADEE